MNRLKKIYGLLLLLLVASCVDPYPTPNLTVNNFLIVVDGFLNASENVVRIKLSQVVNLNSSDTNSPVSNAQVFIKEKDGLAYKLNETISGTYELPITVDFATSYRIEITTQDSKKYYSDFVEVLETPAIDSVTWRPKNDGLYINVNTHGANNKTGYYLWNDVETWEYTSAFQSSYYYQNGNYIFRKPEEEIFRCWKNIPSSDILIGSTSQLSENIISELPLVKIPFHSQKTFIKYSVLVKQQAITQDAFEFWQQLKKNTESLGTLFDPLPSQITGNIYGENNAQALGYFYAATVSEQRLTLTIDDLPESHRFYKERGDCEQDTVKVDVIPGLDPNSYNLVAGIYSQTGALIAFLYSTHYCTDCILQGGTRQKPDFW